MDLERRIVVRDLLMGGLALVLAVASFDLGPFDAGAVTLAISGAIATVSLAYLFEHTTEGIVERFGPHVVAVAIFAAGIVAILAGVAGVVQFDDVGVIAFGMGLAVVGYRLVFGVLRPIPAPLLERERRAQDGR